MIPTDEEIINDIIRLLVDRDPDANPEELRLKLDQPLDQIYKINSQIGTGIASELKEIYNLPDIPQTKLKNRNFYISIGGLLSLIKAMSENS